MAVKKVTAKTETPTAKKIVIKKDSKMLTVDVMDTTGKVTGVIDLPDSVFNAKINKVLMSQAVRVYLANQRQGNARTKSRGEVDLTKAKWYRQKGTGRARHGAQSAPIFVGGGVAHGPKPHDFNLDMPKKMKKAALNSALTSKLKAGEIKVISGFEAMEPKTKQFALSLKTLTSPANRSLLVLADGSMSVVRGIRNVPGVAYRKVTELTPYDVINAPLILLMQTAIAGFEKIKEEQVA